MRIGTLEGTQEEENFVIEQNRNKNNYIWDMLIQDGVLKREELNSHFFIRVTKNKFSQLSKQLVFPKSDVHLVKGNVDNKVLEELNYLLTEKEMDIFNLIPIEKTGVSIKMRNSKNYQILKLTPNSFNALFGNYILGAGASVFCQNEDELIKNKELITGWNLTQSMFDNFFQKNLFKNKNIEYKKEHYKKIKDFSIQYIKNIVDTNLNIQEIIFNGKSIFEEPYCATYTFINNTFKRAEIYPYTVTTGSGRSKGNYTIVFKPSQI